MKNRHSGRQRRLLPTRRQSKSENAGIAKTRPAWWYSPNRVQLLHHRQDFCLLW